MKHFLLLFCLLTSFLTFTQDTLLIAKKCTSTYFGNKKVKKDSACTLYNYNEKGQLISKHYVFRDKKSLLAKSIYNEDFRITKEIVYKKDGDTTITYYQYKEDTIIISIQSKTRQVELKKLINGKSLGGTEKWFNENGEFSYSIKSVFIYDSFKRLTSNYLMKYDNEIETKDLDDQSNGTKIYEKSFEYDSTGKTIRKCSFTPSSNHKSINVFEYDKKDRIVKRTNFSYQARKDTLIKDTIDYFTQYIIKNDSLFEINKNSRFNDYNIKVKPIDKKQFGPSYIYHYRKEGQHEVLKSKTEITYNDKGYPIRSTSYIRPKFVETENGKKSIDLFHSTKEIVTYEYTSFPKSKIITSTFSNHERE